MKRPRIALVHDWLTGMRGGEKLLEIFCDLVPGAPVYTMVHVPGSVSPTIESHPIRTSGLQNLPDVERRYRHYLPLMPWAVRGLNLRGFDLVLSISHCVAKSVLVPPGTPHVCYINTPMRYVWDLFDEYFPADHYSPSTRTGLAAMARWLRWWDRRTARRVTHFVANSNNIRDRVRRAYGRDAEVIYPPVDCRTYRPGGRAGGYFLCVSALAPYKRIDLAVEAFNRLGLPLVVIGTGQDERRLKARAASNIVFLGRQPDAVLRDHYAGCRAFVFPGEEDFGITPLEAMACGRPVIAYGRGGALETVVGLDPDGPTDSPPTGLFFTDQTPEGLVAAVETFQRHEDRFDPDALRRRALAFDVTVCRERLTRLIDEWIGRVRNGGALSDAT